MSATSANREWDTFDIAGVSNTFARSRTFLSISLPFVPVNSEEGDLRLGRMPPTKSMGFMEPVCPCQARERALSRDPTQRSNHSGRDEREVLVTHLAIASGNCIRDRICSLA